MNKLGAAIAASIVLLTAVPAPAAAAPAPAPSPSGSADDRLTWTLVPSSPTGPKGRRQFDYELADKESIVDWFAVSNLGDRPLSIDLYATDAFTATDGGFALLPRSQAPDGVGSWIELPRERVTLPVGKRMDMTFTLKVPANAPPGDHIGGIVASVTEQRVDEKGQRVDVERRIGARVYLRVAGPLAPQAVITAVDVAYDNPVVPIPGGAMTVTYRVANLGNVRLSGQARVQAQGPLGIRLASSEIIDIAELLPDSEIRLTKRFPAVFPAGVVSGTVDVNPRTNKESLPPLTGTGSTTAVPWALLGLVVLAVAFLVYRVFLARFRRRVASFEDAEPGPAAA